MTENEAIERIRDHFEVHHHDNRPHPLLDEAVGMAINALEEVQQYRQIGSVELFAETKKLSDLTKKCGTIGKVFDECAEYAAIGTVEECREAVEKQTAKKVKSISQVKDGDNYICLIGRCPCCGDILEEDTVYCDCGQRLDWEGERWED